MAITLRKHQGAAADAVEFALSQGTKRPLVDMCVAAGKSFTYAELARRATIRNERVIIGAHVRELVEQNAEACRALMPDVHVGVNSASLDQRVWRAPVISASIQSIFRNAALFGTIDKLIVDEAHLLSHSESGMYHTLWCDLGKPDLIGGTGTPFRLQGGRLDQGEGAPFDRIVYTYSILDGIREKYLVPPVSLPAVDIIDPSQLKVRQGEYTGDSQDAQMLKLMDNHIMQMVHYGWHDRRGWLIFEASTKAAHAMHARLNQWGIPAGLVLGTTSDDERERTVSQFRQGKLRALINLNALCVGFNVPHVDLLVLRRRTQSLGLFCQQIGRGLRTIGGNLESSIAAGKADCIAQGQRVLTDCGLVPIERVTKQMKVWDGNGFVRHGGAVCKGEQFVISHAGLDATPDHKVWTKEGWKTFGQCAIEQTPVAVTGNDRKTVREADGYFRNGGAQEKIRQSVYYDAMCTVWCRISQRVHKFDNGQSGLSEMREPTTSARMVSTSRCGCETTLYKSEKGSLDRLWRTWYRISLSVASFIGTLCPRKVWATPRIADRSNRQQQALRTGQHSTVDRTTEHGTYASKDEQCTGASISATSPESSLCRQHSKWFFQSRDDVRTDHRSVLQPSLVQTKRKVWDILNAGPLHRFTVEGLLVSNCAVLDFAGNIDQHGPLDCIEPKSTKASFIECYECGKRNPPGSRTCWACGETLMKNCPACLQPIPRVVLDCPCCGFDLRQAERKQNNSLSQTPSGSALLSSDTKRVQRQGGWVPVRGAWEKDGSFLLDDADGKRWELPSHLGQYAADAKWIRAEPFAILIGNGKARASAIQVMESGAQIVVPMPAASFSLPKFSHGG